MCPLASSIHNLANLEVRRLNVCRLFPTVVADCAVCADGYAPGIAYSCRECSGDIIISAVAVCLVVLLLVIVLLSYLGTVVHDGAQTGRDFDICLWKKKCWSCQASILKTFPLTSVKIVVTVWQIVSQVRGCWFLHNTAPRARPCQSGAGPHMVPETIVVTSYGWPNIYESTIYRDNTELESPISPVMIH